MSASYLARKIQLASLLRTFLRNFELWLIQITEYRGMFSFGDVDTLLLGYKVYRSNI